MAQTFVSDFSSLPTGWTPRWNTTPTWAGGNPLAIPNGVNNDWCGLSLDAIDSDADRDNVELYVKFSTPATLQTTRFLFVRGSGADESATHIHFSLLASGHSLGYCSGSDARVNIQTHSTSYSGSTTYKAIIRCNGTTLQTKVWVDGDPEPGSWQIGTTDANVTGVGWVGFCQGSNVNTPSIIELGIGTNGDAAPQSAGSSWSAAASETTTPADACTATFTIDATAGIVETASPSDVSAAAIDAVAALVETTSPADVASAAATLLAAISDLATPADAASASFSTPGAASIVETTTGSDAITAAATLLRQVAEAATPSDQASAATTLVRLVTEQAVPVDQATVQGGDEWTVSIEELATAIDVITASFTAAGALRLSVPPIGHGPELARRVAAVLASRRPNLSTRTR